MDVVVTVPKHFWLDWIEEGDAVGEPPTGEEWGFFMGGHAPRIEPGERVYVVAHGRLRGYAPLTRVARTERGFALCRREGAVAVTVDEEIPGFRGWRQRWWKREDEVPFPNWKFHRVRMPTREGERAVAELARTFAEGRP